MPLFNMQGVIALLATPGTGAGGGNGRYTFTAGPTFTNVRGTVTPSGPGPSFDAMANWQPASGKTMQMLAEGTKAEDVRDMWVSTMEVITPSSEEAADGSGGRRGHSVVIDGSTYEVVRAKDWRANGGYWEISVQKVSG